MFNKQEDLEKIIFVMPSWMLIVLLFIIVGEIVFAIFKYKKRHAKSSKSKK